ncbi:MAG TPA: hypothetical protein VHE79_09355, partial [Spirochaetia bacterium]
GHDASGAWPGLHGGAEDFLFACPNNQGFLRGAIASLDALVDLVKPDGVMLDRIRYPSPANGLESLFSCFCPACQALFTAETGLPLSRAREDVRELLGSLSRMDGGDLEALRGRSVFPWVTDALAALARFRADSVLRATRRLSTRARERGLAVGLDLFSPSLAGLVGQDYAALAGICDWIKPMTYCRAVGPAGLSLELASLRAGLAALAPRADGTSVARLLSERFGWDIPDSPQALLRDGLPARVITTELESIRALGLPARVAVYAGIEAVSNPAFGIDIRPDDLEAALSMSAGLCQGVVASWNLLSIPRESLRRIGALRT